ncbi:hypothetical protein GGI42DRAFT_139701 [Trichoderma sp. SZMC 28013]
MSMDIKVSLHGFEKKHLRDFFPILSISRLYQSISRFVSRIIFWERDVRRLALLLRDDPELESRFKDTEDGQFPALRLYLSPEGRWYWRIVTIIRLIVDGDNKASRKILTLLRQSEALREGTHESAKREVGDASLQWPNDTSQQDLHHVTHTPRYQSKYCSWILEKAGQPTKSNLWVENTTETWNIGSQKHGSIVNIASPQIFILLNA